MMAFINKDKKDEIKVSDRDGTVVEKRKKDKKPEPEITEPDTIEFTERQRFWEGMR